MGFQDEGVQLLRVGTGFLSTIWDRVTALRNRLNAWRRIQFTKAGLVFSLGAFAVGFVAFNTGNNLLYLLFGAMLGLIVVSGWLSEQVIRDLGVYRQVPRGVTVGNPVRLYYEVENRRKRIPSFALEIGEAGLHENGFLPTINPGGRGYAQAETTFVQRGIFELTAVQVSTSFPFGLFLKSRDLPMPGELVVWPRSDRNVRPPEPGGGTTQRAGAFFAGAAGLRGEYRGLRNYRPGDDPRDIHWRTSARLGQPMVREYEESDSESLWLCLDTGGPPGNRAEVAIEIVASLAARAFREGRRFGFVCPGQTIEAGLGPGQLERILGALARVDFSPDTPLPRPPVARRRCILVTLRPGAGQGFGDQYSPPREASP
jgi:uncharacterized protein (DUF58 family)